MDESSQHPSSSWRIHLQPEARRYETKINSMHSPTELKPSSFRPNNFSYSSPSSSLPGSSVPSCHDSDFTTASSPSTLGLRHPGYSRSSPRVSNFFTATSSTLDFDEHFDDPSAWEAPNLVGYSSSQMLSDPPYTEEPFDLQLHSVSPENLLYQPDPWKALDDLLDLRPEVLVRQNDNDSIPAVHSFPVPDLEVDIFKRTDSDIQCDESDVEDHAVLSDPVLDHLVDYSSATSNMVPAQDGFQDFSSSLPSPSMSFINDQDLSNYSPMHLNDLDQPQPSHATDSGSPPRHIKLSHRLPRYFEDDEHLEIEVEPPRYITSPSGNPNKDSSCLDSGHISEYGSLNGPPGHPAVQGPNVDDGVSLLPQVKAVSSPRDSEPLERHVTFSSPPTTMSSLHDVVVPEPDSRLALRSNTNRVLRKEGDFYVGPCLFFDDFDDED
ncbi:hypothetical protein ONZ45_g6130 [Pleurotus djamor]|nr:hypothetical protein ONZ45_g6130 [Pleurotus djamor]